MSGASVSTVTVEIQSYTTHLLRHSEGAEHHISVSMLPNESEIEGPTGASHGLAHERYKHGHSYTRQMNAGVPSCSSSCPCSEATPPVPSPRPGAPHFRCRWLQHLHVALELLYHGWQTWRRLGRNVDVGGQGTARRSFALVLPCQLSNVVSWPTMLRLPRPLTHMTACRLGASPLRQSLPRWPIHARPLRTSTRKDAIPPPTALPPAPYPLPPWIHRLPSSLRWTHPYVSLARMDKPIGTWLLYWPCGELSLLDASVQ